MAYTITRKRSDGTPRYVGRYRVDGQLKNTSTFARKREALEEAKRLKDLAKRNDYVDPAAATITLDEYFAARQAARSVATRTLETEAERYRSLIGPRFGPLPLKRISPEDVADWSANMTSARSGEIASPARRRDAVRLLSSLLDDAVDARRLQHNPVRKRSGRMANLPRAPKTKAHRYLSHEELARLADCAPNAQGRALILFAGLSGLRWGELAALKVSDVNTLRWRVRVEQAFTRLDSGALELGDTKTHAARVVPIFEPARAPLAELMAGKARGAWLFASKDGDPLRRESFSRNTFGAALRVASSAVSELQRLLFAEDALGTGTFDRGTREALEVTQRAAGLPVTGACDGPTWEALGTASADRATALSQGEKVARTRKLHALARCTLSAGVEDFEPLTLHDLRHTAASLAIQSGATVKVVQSMLGHESAKMTLDTYAELFDQDLDALAARMGEAHRAALAHNMRTNPDSGAGEVVVLPRPDTA